MFLAADSPEPAYTDTIELDLGNVVPSMAGPKRPQDRIDLGDVKKNFVGTLSDAPRKVAVLMDGNVAEVQDIISRTHPNTNINIKVIRGGQPKLIKVKTELMPKQEGDQAPENEGGRSFFRVPLRR